MTDSSNKGDKSTITITGENGSQEAHELAVPDIGHSNARVVNLSRGPITMLPALQTHLSTTEVVAAAPSRNGEYHDKLFAGLRDTHHNPRNVSPFSRQWLTRRSSSSLINQPLLSREELMDRLTQQSLASLHSVDELISLAGERLKTYYTEHLYDGAQPKPITPGSEITRRDLIVIDEAELLKLLGTENVPIFAKWHGIEQHRVYSDGKAYLIFENPNASRSGNFVKPHDRTGAVSAHQARFTSSPLAYFLEEMSRKIKDPEARRRLHAVLLQHDYPTVHQESLPDKGGKFKHQDQLKIIERSLLEFEKDPLHVNVTQDMANDFALSLIMRLPNMARDGQPDIMIKGHTNGESSPIENRPHAEEAVRNFIAPAVSKQTLAHGLDGKTLEHLLARQIQVEEKILEHSPSLDRKRRGNGERYAALEQYSLSQTFYKLAGSKEAPGK